MKKEKLRNLTVAIALLATVSSSAAYLATTSVSNSADTENDSLLLNHSESCKYCNGQGTYDCNMCDGAPEGMRTCSMCQGEGTITYRDGSKEKCESCNGKGKFECGYCKKGKRTCTACNGTGEQRYLGR